MKTHGVLRLTGQTLCGVLLRPGVRVMNEQPPTEVESSYLRPIKVTSIKKEVTCGNCLKTQ